MSLLNPFDITYHNLLQDILKKGVRKEDRTGTGTLSVFGRQLRFDLSKGFPLLTTKKVFFRGVVIELLWILKGDTNIKYLVDNNVHIWDEWPYEKYVKCNTKNVTQEKFVEMIKEDGEFAKKWGNLGPVYGAQWRKWQSGKEKIDQISQVINQIKTNPSSRRHIVSAWNTAYIDQMAIPPCHTLFQFYVADGKLSCQLYQRSADVFLGVPFNIASYSLLTYMLAQVCNLKVGEFIHTFGDVHIYLNHIDQVKLQLSRKPNNPPVLKLNSKIKNIFDFKFEDISIQNYNPHPPIKAPVAV